MAEEKFTLAYTDFQANAAEVFSELRQETFPAIQPSKSPDSDEGTEKI